MKISVTDKNGSGIASQFAEAIGATVKGRFFHIPQSKGEGYMTGFNWANKDLRMMVQNYYLKEEVLLERTNELAEGQDDIIFALSGVFTSNIEQEKYWYHNNQMYLFVCMLFLYCSQCLQTRHSKALPLQLHGNTFVSSLETYSTQ